MTTEHLAALFPAVFTGLGLILVGGVNLLLLRKGVVVRLAASTTAVAVTLGAARAIDQPDVVEQTLGYLLAGLATVLLLGWRPLTEATAAVMKFLAASPATRYALMSLSGLAVAVGSVVVFDRADEQALNQSLSELELLCSYRPGVPTEKAKALTDRGRPITLREPESLSDAYMISEAERRLLEQQRLDGSIIRRGPASELCNCHGWVFAGGAYRISGEDVEAILTDNGYQPVEEPQPGDVVVYRNGGAVSHTAVVRYVSEGQPVLVEGKWGQLGVFLHAVDRSFYGTDYTFYRTNRATHLLRGLGGQPNTTDAPPVVASE